MDMIVPKYHTFRMVASDTETLWTMLQDFFMPVFAQRKLSPNAARTPIDHNRFAHALGFPSYQRFMKFLKSGECSEEARDLLEYGRSLLESDHTEGGLTGDYNAALVKTVLSGYHSLSEKIDHVSSDGSMTPAGQQALPPELAGMLDYLHDDSVASLL